MAADDRGSESIDLVMETEDREGREVELAMYAVRACDNIFALFATFC